MCPRKLRTLASAQTRHTMQSMDILRTALRDRLASTTQKTAWMQKQTTALHTRAPEQRAVAAAWHASSDRNYSGGARAATAEIPQGVLDYVLGQMSSHGRAVPYGERYPSPATRAGLANDVANRFSVNHAQAAAWVSSVLAVNEPAGSDDRAAAAHGLLALSGSGHGGEVTAANRYLVEEQFAARKAWLEGTPQVAPPSGDAALAQARVFAPLNRASDLLAIITADADAGVTARTLDAARAFASFTRTDIGALPTTMLSTLLGKIDATLVGVRAPRSNPQKEQTEAQATYTRELERVLDAARGAVAYLITNPQVGAAARSAIVRAQEAAPTSVEETHGVNAGPPASSVEQAENTAAVAARAAAGPDAAARAAATRMRDEGRLPSALSQAVLGVPVSPADLAVAQGGVPPANGPAPPTPVPAPTPPDAVPPPPPPRSVLLTPASLQIEGAVPVSTGSQATGTPGTPPTPAPSSSVARSNLFTPGVRSTPGAFTSAESNAGGRAVSEAARSVRDAIARASPSPADARNASVAPSPSILSSEAELQALADAYVSVDPETKQVIINTVTAPLPGSSIEQTTTVVQRIASVASMAGSVAAAARDIFNALVREPEGSAATPAVPPPPPSAASPAASPPPGAAMVQDEDGAPVPAGATDDELRARAMARALADKPEDLADPVSALERRALSHRPPTDVLFDAAYSELVGSKRKIADKIVGANAIRAMYGAPTDLVRTYGRPAVYEAIVTAAVNGYVNAVRARVEGQTVTPEALRPGGEHEPLVPDLRPRRVKGSGGAYGAAAPSVTGGALPPRKTMSHAEIRARGVAYAANLDQASSATRVWANPHVARAAKRPAPLPWNNPLWPGLAERRVKSRGDTYAT